MTLSKTLGILLIVAGALGLLYGGFTYTKATHSANLGPIVLQVQERETVTIPVLLSAFSFVVGVFLLVRLRIR